MAVLLFILLIVSEIGFAVFEITKKNTKKEWTKKRLYADIVQAVSFILMIFLPGIDLSFRFKGLFFVLILRVLFAGISTLTHRKNIIEKKISGIVISAFASAVLFFVSMVPAFVFADYEGRTLTGEYEVGERKAILVDGSRLETFETDGSHREVPVYFYYPEKYSGDLHSLPLVLFSHGAFGYYQSNTSTYMELASHGYVVVSLEHPYHSLFTNDSDGKLITVDPEFFNTALKIGSDEESGYSEEEIFEITGKWMELRIADMNFAIDSLKEAACGDYESFLFAYDDKEKIDEIMRLVDTGKIGLMGHSLGGATAVTVGRREDISAVIDLDGTMLGEETSVENGTPVINDAPYHTPLLCLTNEPHHNEALEAEKIAYSYANNVILNSADEGFETYIKGSLHMNFTDLPLFSPFLSKRLGGMGTVDPGVCIDTVNSLVLNFFDCYLKGTGTFTVNESY